MLDMRKEGNETILDDYVPGTTQQAEDEVVEEVEVSANRNNATGVITVTCGANTSAFGEIAGKSIGQLRQDLGDVLNIAPDSQVIVSGENVDENYILQAGDRVEFIKASGVKG